MKGLGEPLSENLIDVDGVHIKVINTNGEESFERLDTGRASSSSPASKGSGRGFSGDCNIIDEAFAYTAIQQDALMPTMSARPNPQIVYTSAAAGWRRRQRRGDVRPARASGGRRRRQLRLAGLGDRGRPRPPGRDRLGRPAVVGGVAIRRWATDSARRRCCGSAGRWATPGSRGSGSGCGRGSRRAMRSSMRRLGRAWRMRTRSGTATRGRDRLWTSVAAAGLRRGLRVRAARGRLGHTQLADYRPGTKWLVPRLVELREALGPMSVAMGRGTFAFLETALDKLRTSTGRRIRRRHSRAIWR
jgi:hypothetical protein